MDLTNYQSYLVWNDVRFRLSLKSHCNIFHLAHLLIFSVYEEIVYIFKFPTHGDWSSNLKYLIITKLKIREINTAKQYLFYNEIGYPLPKTH